jgi:AcrR family transcriptional regulator
LLGVGTTFHQIDIDVNINICTSLLQYQQVVRSPAVAEPVRAPRRSQTERRSASEEALLDAAAELIAERGIDRASFPRIGDRAGTSRGLPTHHFGSKDALVDRLATRTQERFQAAVADARATAASAEPEPLSALEGLRVTMAAYLALFVDATPEARALIVMWGATFPSESSLPAMRDADRRTHRGWMDGIRRGQEDGSIRDDVDPAAAASALLALSRGFAALLLADPEVLETTDVRATCDLWITTVLASEGSRNG